jgi:hypothetical protein
MRIASALLIALLSVGLAGCSRTSPSPALAVNPKPAPEVVALNQDFPLYGVSHGPLIAPRPQEPPPATQAARDLRAYYQDSKKEPVWKEAVRQLSAAEPVERTKAASYLRDLLDQALKDEEAGAAPWQALPFWDGHGYNPARGLRERVAAALTEEPQAQGALPVVAWFLERERLTRLQGQALQAAARLQGPEADALFLPLATRPHPNVEVAQAALAQVEGRKIKLTPEQLTPLCQHHRTRLREAARALNTRLGYAEPPPFDAARAVQSEPLRRLMDDIGQLVAGPAPADAPFVLLTIPEPNGQPANARGWLLEDDGEAWVLLTPNGRRSRFPKKSQGGAAVTLTQVPIQDEVDRVARLRREGDKNFEMSSRGGFSGQFEGHGAGEYEALLAQWLFAGGRFEQAAAILLPALDTLLLDSHLVDITRDRLGDWYGQEMLAEFVGDRDYAKAELRAKRLVERFAGTRFRAEALRLLDELPRRRDDFDGLRLPTPAEWATQKGQMTRREQIDFLGRRLRLLNAFQISQPGGAWYGVTQYAEPCGISQDASWGRWLGKTAVINPLVELAGPMPGGGAGLPPTAQSEGMSLTVADIPALAEHLREDWLILAVSFHRDFSPGRVVHRTRPLVVSLISRLARRQLCRAEKLDAMTDKERDEEIARLTKWAEENRDKDETALLLEALQDALDSGTHWLQVRPQAMRLTDLKVKAAVPLFYRFVEAGVANDYDVRLWSEKIEPGALEALARPALKHEDPKVRMRAALLLRRTGDQAEALAVLGDGLENGTVLLVEAVSALFSDEAPDSRATAVRVFNNRRLTALDARTRSLVVTYATSARVPDGLRLYLRLLETPGNTIDGLTYDRPVAEVAAEEILDSPTLRDGALDEIKKRPALPPDKVAAVKAWVRGRIEKMEGQK